MRTARDELIIVTPRRRHTSVHQDATRESGAWSSRTGRPDRDRTGVRIAWSSPDSDDRQTGQSHAVANPSGRDRSDKDGAAYGSKTPERRREAQWIGRPWTTSIA